MFDLSAFAELQTDMTDLTGDIVSSGIPFWDYHSYTFKVLFPGMSDHVILHPPLVSTLYSRCVTATSPVSGKHFIQSHCVIATSQVSISHSSQCSTTGKHFIQSHCVIATSQVSISRSSQCSTTGKHFIQSTVS